MASISTRAPLGRAATATQERAGASAPKVSLYTPFTIWNSAMSTMNTVTLVTSAGVAPASEPEPEAFPAFDFTLTDQYGNTHTLSDYKGKVVFLNFWATWCSNCVKEMPAIEKLYEEYGDQIVIVGVNVGEDEDTIDTFIEAKNYSFPVACDTESNISNLYPSAGIPYTVIIGKDGLVTETFLGAKDADSQYTKLRRALQEAYEAN